MEKIIFVIILITSILSCNNHNVSNKKKWNDIIGDTATWNKKFNKDTIIQINTKLHDTLK